MNSEQVEEIIEEPMGDDDIKFYFPNAKILKYSELANYSNIDELLPTNKDYAFILYEDSPNKGHWTCLSKNDNNIEYFDSYGGKPDNPLNWNNKQINNELGQGQKLLSNLLDGSDRKVIYNPKKYQKDGSDINTCGRHCTFRLKQMKGGRNLQQYYEFMKNLKNNTGKSYDEIVASFIKKV